MEYMELIQPLLVTILTVVAPAALTALAGWFLKLRQQVDTEIKARNLGIVRDLALAFVRAAEQSGLSGQLEDLAESKREYVLSRLQAESDRLGLGLDFSVLEAILEDAFVEAFDFSDAQ